MAVNPMDSSVRCMAAMEQLLRSAGPSTRQIAFPDRLDRGQLDFSLASLAEVDRYLNFVHQSAAEGEGRSVLTTLWAMALYVGEVIRRQAPAGRYEWITVGDSSPHQPMDQPTDQAPQVDIGIVWALRAGGDDVCLPSRAVLRVVLRGRKARSIESFARGVLEPSMGSSALGPRRRDLPIAVHGLSA